MHQVESAFLQAGAQAIGLLDFDVVQPALGDLGTRHVYKTCLSFNSDHRSLWADAPRQQVQNPDRAATNIDGSPSGLDRDSVQEPIGIRLIGLGLCEQPL